MVRVQWHEQGGDGECQRVRDTEETQHRKVAVPVLNLDDICETQTRFSGEFCLGKTLALPGLTDRRPQERQQRGGIAERPGGTGSSHGRIIPSPVRTLGVVGGSGGLDGMRVHLAKEPGCGELQDRRNTQQCQHRNIAFSPFDLADIRVPYAYTGGEGAMGESPLLSVLAEGCPQTLQRGILRG